MTTPTTPRPPWAGILERRGPVPDDDHYTPYTAPPITVQLGRGATDGQHPSTPDAIKLALRAGDIVAAMDDPTATTTADRYDLLDLLRAVRDVRLSLAGFEEHLITGLRDRQDAHPGTGASWADLAGIYHCDKATMRQRAARMRDAADRGTTDAWDREADPHYWRDQTVLTRHPTWGWRLVGGPRYIVERLPAELSTDEAMAHTGALLHDLFDSDVRWTRELHPGAVPVGETETWRATIGGTAPHVATPTSWHVFRHGGVAVIHPIGQADTRWTRQVGALYGTPPPPRRPLRDLHARHNSTDHYPVGNSGTN